MRCSLLTLSSYVDAELPPETAGELEAHLVACRRCSEGLAYLREEAERVHELAVVHAPEGAAEKVLVEVGLAIPPDATPPPEPPASFEPAFRHATEPALEPTFEFAADVAARAEHPPNGTRNGTHEIAHEMDREIEPEATPPTVASTLELEDDAPEPGDEPEPGDAPEPDVASEPTRGPVIGDANFLDRMRDAIAVRMALWRGANVSDSLDESVQIVSGTGAPGWGGHTAQQTHRERRERMAAASAVSVAEPPLDVAGGPPAPPEPESNEPPPEPSEGSPPVPGWYSPRQGAPPPTPAEAGSEGRHQRAVHSGGASRRWGLGSLGAAASRPGVEKAIADRRLWLFSGTVVVLLLIGLLVGKSVTTAPRITPPNAIPNPTAIAANPTATPIPTHRPQPTPTPTAAPTPRPSPAAGPANLANAQTLGSGGTGWTVQDARYGAHPNDFRIVLDLSGGSATPSAQVGYGDPTTFYVELSGTKGAAVAQPPSGNTATSVQLMQPSPVAGKVVYKITLSHAAQNSTYFLLGPTRLVIDLTG
ncbi:MAG: zf-HC2 domain-containing protein [Candidatus Dormibacteraeota bacterium]|nr:zf-HC2 domain-containing protein [Candidatus Dormibacteraeota bacterium]